MSAKAFIDTNVLVYAIQLPGDDLEKPNRARSLLRGDDLCLSTQVLGEFYRAVTSRRRAQPLSHSEAAAWVQLWKRIEVLSITVAHVDLALEITERFDIGYYDALILSSARMAGCRKVYSEDLNPGQEYNGVTVLNPFLQPS
jgi:predicted nucleic acid-binding protein